MTYVYRKIWQLLLVVLLVAGCSGPHVDRAAQEMPAAAQDRTITVTFLQLNDVYEIEPVEAGRRGGLARVATVRHRLVAENPNTFTVIAGDFYSPSALGTARVDDERLAGKQMVAVLNALGLDYATFGNHEFDVSRDQFHQRLQESDFTYVSGNVFDENGHPFPGVKPYALLTIPGQPGDTLRLGLLGVTLESNRADYVRYAEAGAVETIKQQAVEVAPRTDALVGLTHLAIDEDMKIAESVPAFDLIMGGHEHENILMLRGPALQPIAKADANARTVYVHTLRYDPATGTVETTSQIKHITDQIASDPQVADVVDHWVGLAFEGFRQQGLKPAEPVCRLPEPFDGRESSVRNRSTNLTQLIADAMLHEVEGAGLAVYNSGSIRIDDVLPAAMITQYDLIRVLPFGGQVVSVDMKGSLLDSTLTQGLANAGSGGFLQHAGVSRDADGTWHVGEQPVDPEQTYRVAISDFLVTGLEANLDYLTFDNPGLTKVAAYRDIRQVVIDELKRRFDTY